MPLALWLVVRARLAGNGEVVGGAGNVMVAFASVLHLSWSLSLLLSSAPLAATPIAMMHELFPHGHYVLAVLLIIASGLAVIGLLVKHPTIALMCLLPQQALLLISAVAGMKAAWLGKYADGTVINANQIFADQVIYFLAAMMYMLAVVLVYVARAVEADE